MANSVVNLAISDARKFAHEILRPQPTEEGAPSSEMHVIHHYPYIGSCDWGYPRAIYFGDRLPSGSHSTSSETSSKKKKGNDKIEALIALTILAVVAVGVASSSIGRELGRISNVRLQKRQLAEHKFTVLESRDPERKKGLEVLKIEEEILTSLQTKAEMGIATKGLLASSLTIAAIGGWVLGFGMWTGAALACSALSGAAALVRWGYEDADSSIRQKAFRLLRSVEEIDGIAMKESSKVSEIEAVKA